MLVLLVFIGASLLAPVEAGNCTLQEPMLIDREGTLYNVSGPVIHIHPKLNGVPQYDISLSWTVSLFVERDKILVGGPGYWVYSAPRPTGSPFDPMVDPLLPYNANVNCPNFDSVAAPCGPILQHINVEDLDCWAERVIAPFHGHTRESIYVHFSNASWPGFTFVSEHHIVDGDVTVEVGNPGIPAQEVYTANALKVGYSWQNYPWAGNSTISYFDDGDQVYNSGSAFEFWFIYDRTSLFSLNTPKNHCILSFTPFQTKLLTYRY